MIESVDQPELRISKMSDESIEALLQYLYYDSVDGPASSPEIIIDLVEASPSYEIKPLFETMCYVIGEETRTLYLKKKLRKFLD